MINIRQDDMVLITRFQTGNTNAFDTLIHKHQKRAYQYAFRLSRDAEVAADVVAETFVRIYRALPNFKGESAFTTWMYRILTNCFLDMRKKESTRAHLSLDSHMITEEGEVEVQIVDKSDSPYQESEQNERARTIATAIHQLLPYQKAMILMYHVEMLSYEEIAVSLDLPIGTVKSRLNRSRNCLKTILSEQEDMLAVA